MPWSLEEYERFVYQVQELSPHVIMSTLVLQRRGKLAAFVSGEVLLAKGITLSVYENLSFVSVGTGFIKDYGYEVRVDDSVHYWYDSQPHPNDPTLQLNHPHHKHIPPNIKRNRVPAPELTFHEPNLPFLIREIENRFFASSIQSSE